MRFWRYFYISKVKMSRRRALPNNIDVFLSFMCKITKSSSSNISEADIRRVIYLCKMYDLLWFDDYLPSGIQETISFVLNATWQPTTVPYGVEQIAVLNLRSLIYITSRLRSPDWLSNGQKFVMSIADVFDPEIKSGERGYSIP
jgi:hypothetical protein